MTNGQRNGASLSQAVRFLFRALRHRNYKLFFFGQGISVIGTWMQGAALGWLIFELSKKAGQTPEFWLGLIPFVGQLPTFVLPPLTGVLADRWPRRRILMATQTLAMVQALVLAALVISGMASLWWVMALAILLGLINSLDIPARQSFTLDMVEDRADLANAIALNSSLVNGARVVGPVVAGALIATIGTGTCFLINGISYLAVIWALAAMRVPPQIRPQTQKRVWHDLIDGANYALHNRPIRSVLGLVALTSFMGVSYGVLMPVVAKHVLGGDSHLFGWLLGAAGIGALVGVVCLASRTSIRGLKSLIALGALIFGVGLVAFSLAAREGFVWLSLACMIVTGFGMMTTMSSSNTFLQAIVDDDKRGRVMSFWTMAFMGMVPFGSLFTGGIASTGFGPVNTLLLEGICCIGGAALFATRLPMLRRLTHPIYVRKGLIPQVMLGTATAPPEAGEPPSPPNPSAGDPHLSNNQQRSTDTQD